MDSTIEEKINSKIELIQQQTGDKYNKSGCYIITCLNKILYVGSSKNILNRLANHLVHIEDENNKSNKYVQMRRVVELGFPLKFDILCECPEEEIKFREAEYIAQLKPYLNTQLPYRADPRKYRYNKQAQTITAEQIMGISN